MTNKNKLDNSKSKIQKPVKVKEKKQKKIKTFSSKKIPSFYKKKKNLKNIDKRIFKYLLVAEDNKFVRSLYIEKDGLFIINEEVRLTKKDLKRLKKIVKEIKSQKAFRINLLPLAISIGFIFALFFTIILTKDFVLKLIVQKMGESIFQAKCDIDLAHIEFLNAHIRLEGLQQANKDSVMTNLFEIEVIDLDFDLVQLLKRKFVSENIQVSGLEFGTERKTSGFLPKKEKKVKEQKEKDESAGFNINAILDLPIIKDEKNDIIDAVSSFNPETILANLQDSLRSPDLAIKIQEEVILKYQKYEGLPKDLEKDINEVQAIVKDIQAIDIEDLKQNPSKIPEFLSFAESSFNTTKEISSRIETTSTQIKNDAKLVQAYSKEITDAFNADFSFIRSEVQILSSFSFGDAKNLLTGELEKIAIRSLGKYYPYAVMAMEKAQSFSTKSKEPKKESKAKKEKKALVRTGRIVEYKKDAYPSLLFKNIYFLSHIQTMDIEAELKNISNDMNLWGYPSTAEFTIDFPNVKNYGSLVFDTRENKENLISLRYDGSGYEMDFSKFNQNLSDGLSQNIPGLPHISGTSLINAVLLVDDFDEFSLDGTLVLDPARVKSDPFEPNFVYLLYKRALEKLNTLDASFKLKNSKDDGFNLSLSSHIDEYFVSIFSELLNEELATIKNAAIEEAEKYLKDSLSPVYDAIGEFDSIEDLVNTQKKKLESYQKDIEKKIDEAKKAATAKLEAEKQKALEEAQKEIDKAKEKAIEAAEEAAKDLFKGFF